MVLVHGRSTVRVSVLGGMGQGQAKSGHRCLQLLKPVDDDVDLLGRTDSPPLTRWPLPHHRPRGRRVPSVGGRPFREVLQPVRVTPTAPPYRSTVMHQLALAAGRQP